MGEFNHLVIVKFKEGVAADGIIQGLEKLVSGFDVKSFKWGTDIDNPEALTQGYTHAFLITFNSKEAYKAFQVHPDHVDYSTKFQAQIEKVLALDFPTN